MKIIALCIIVSADDWTVERAIMSQPIHTIQYALINLIIPGILLDAGRSSLG